MMSEGEAMTGTRHHWDISPRLPTVKELKEMKIAWHPTTPTRFRCMPWCCCCCAEPWFLPSEAGNLPLEIRDKLRIKTALQGRIKIIAPKPFREGREGSCCFFDKKSAHHCLIHPYRPIKCKLYPFFPIVTGTEIIIFAEPFLDIREPPRKKAGEETPPWLNCYGLGQGKHVDKKEIKKLALDYIIGLREEYPPLFPYHIRTNPEIYLRQDLIEKQKMLIRKFDEDAVRRLFSPR
jgi:Fe-S-cluster containining protein